MKHVLDVEIQFDVSEVKRKISGESIIKSYKVCLDSVLASKVKTYFSDALLKIHDVHSSQVLDSIKKEIHTNTLLAQYQEFHRFGWHLGEFFRTVHSYCQRNKNKNYEIIMKACQNYYFYILYVKEDGGNLKVIHDPFFQKATPPLKIQEDDKCRGVYDTLLFLSDALADITKYDEVESLLSWFDLHIYCKVKNCGKDTMKLQTSTKIGQSNILSISKKNKVLVVSPNVREAIAKLSEAWVNTTAKSVLISASPGSGKELLVGLFSDAMAIHGFQRINISSPEIKDFSKVIDRLSKKNLKKMKYIVFFDEIHHDSAIEVRTGLLRMMESGEFTDSAGKPHSCQNLMYVLAGSIPPEEMRLKSPPDFWTRIEYTIKMEHPLRVKETERSPILAKYFEFFWGLAAKDWKKEYIDNDYGLYLINEMEKLTTELGNIFIEKLSSPLIPIISIRILRSVVKRLFNKSLLALRGMQGFNENSKRTFIDLFGAWAVDITLELVPEIHKQGLF